MRQAKGNCKQNCDTLFQVGRMWGHFAVRTDWQRPLWKTSEDFSVLWLLLTNLATGKPAISVCLRLHWLLIELQLLLPDRSKWIQLSQNTCCPIGRRNQRTIAENEGFCFEGSRVFERGFVQQVGARSAVMLVFCTSDPAGCQGQASFPNLLQISTSILKQNTPPPPLCALF